MKLENTTHVPKTNSYITSIKTGDEEKLSDDLVKQLRDGINLYVFCEKCKSYSIIPYGFCEKSYTRLVRSNKCPSKNCNEIIPSDNVLKLYFRNCEINFEGIVKATDQEFKQKYIHTEFSSPYAFLDIDDFLIYLELNFKISKIDLAKFPNKSLEDVAKDVLSFKDKQVKEISVENLKLYDELVAFKNLLHIQKEISMQEMEYIKIEFKKVSESMVTCTENLEQKQNEINNIDIELKTDEAKLEQLKKDLRESDEDIRRTQEKIREYEKRRMDLAKWWWVPGYNYYLIGRTIKDAVDDIPRLEDKKNRIVRDKGNLEKEFIEKRKEKENLEKNLVNLKNEKIFYDKEKERLIEKEDLLSFELVYYERCEKFFAELEVGVESLEDKNKIFQSFLEIFDEDEYLQDDDYLTYEESFLNLARLLDERIYNTPLRIPGDYSYFLKN